MIDLAVVKKHLRVEHNDEDDLIQGYLDAAVSAFETWSNRTVVAEVKEDSPANVIILTPAISQGILLLVGQWYANRESVLTGSIVTTFPMATQALWAPHRWINV